MVISILPSTCMLLRDSSLIAVIESSPLQLLLSTSMQSMSSVVVFLQQVFASFGAILLLVWWRNRQAPADNNPTVSCVRRCLLRWICLVPNRKQN